MTVIDCSKSITENFQGCIHPHPQPVLCGVLKELCAIRDNTSLCDIADKNDIVVLINDMCIN